MLNSKKNNLLKEIMLLHKEIEEECTEKLKVVDHCLMTNKECSCINGECLIDKAKLLKISQKYKELHLLEKVHNLKKMIY